MNVITLIRPRWTRKALFKTLSENCAFDCSNASARSTSVTVNIMTSHTAGSVYNNDCNQATPHYSGICHCHVYAKWSICHKSTEMG